MGDGFSVPMQIALDQGIMSVESMISGRAGTGGKSTIEDLKAALVEVNTINSPSVITLQNGSA